MSYMVREMSFLVAYHIVTEYALLYYTLLYVPAHYHATVGYLNPTLP